MLKSKGEALTMFKFDDYPEIKKAYREHSRLTRILYREEKRMRPDDEDSEIPWKIAHENLVDFNQNSFAKSVFNAFKDKKPKLYSQVKECFAKWDKVFPDNWEEFNEGQKYELLSLVLEIGYGQYWLPDEYYDDKLIDGCIKPPKTHTKPFKCW